MKNSQILVWVGFSLLLSMVFAIMEVKMVHKQVDNYSYHIQDERVSPINQTVALNIAAQQHQICIKPM
jgi:hypothetical protein